MNATLDEEKQEIVRWSRCDIGMAVDAEEGLVVPVIRDAGGKTLVELAREVERLSEGARSGTLAPTELSGSTFTVTSIGSIGGLFSYPVINPPEALSLSFDHRLIDGGTATRFLNDLILRIEEIHVP